MGNQNSLMAHTKPLQEEAGSTEPRRKLVVGNDSPLYGAMDVVNKVSPGASKKNNKREKPFYRQLSSVKYYIELHDSTE